MQGTEFRGIEDLGCRELRIRGNEGWTAEALKSIGQCPRLQVLSIENCEVLDGDVIEALMKGCSALRMLKVFASESFTAELAQQVAGFGLRRIDVTDCLLDGAGLRCFKDIPRVTLPNGEARVFGGSKEEISLSADGQELQKRVRANLDANSVDASDLHGLTDEDLSVLGECNNLQELVLRGCRNLTGAGFCWIPDTVEALDVEDCVAVSDEDLWDLPVGLRYLNVSGCQEVIGHDLRRQFPELSSLEVDLSTDGQKLRRLLGGGGDSVDTRSCQGIVDRDLMLLACCRKLVTASFRGCRKLTGKGLAHLPPSVRNLDVSDCPKIDDDALDQVSRELRQLTVRGCSRVIGGRLDRQFPALQGLRAEKCWALRVDHLPPALRFFSLSGSELTDDDLKNLPEELAELHLAKCHRVTEEALAARVGNMRVVTVRDCRLIQPTEPLCRPVGFLHDRFVNNPWRRDVVLNGNGAIENANIANLAKARHLRSISFSNCAFDDEGLRILAGLPHLEELTLAHCPNVTGAGFDAIPADSALRRVTISHCTSFSDPGAIALGRHRGLRSLTLNYVNTSVDPSLSGAALSQLAGAVSLETVSLEGIGKLGNLAVAALLSNSALRRLRVTGSERVTHEAFAKVRDSELRELELMLCPNVLKGGPFSRGSLAFLEQFNQLERLALNGLIGMRESDVALIGQHLPQLRSLSLASCSDLTHAHLAGLAGCADLEELSLSEIAGVINATLQAIERNHPKLQRLDLRKCVEIDDQGMNCVGHLPDLKHLDVGYCEKVSIAGLGVLAGCKKLRTPETKGMKLSDGDRAALANMFHVHHASEKVAAHRAKSLAAAFEDADSDGDDGAVASAADQYGHTPGAAAAVADPAAADGPLPSQYGRVPSATAAAALATPPYAPQYAMAPAPAAAAAASGQYANVGDVRRG